MSENKTDDKNYQGSPDKPWRAHFGEKMMRTYITNGERTIYTSKDDADFLVEALNRSAKVESIEIPPARFYGGTIQDEISRAQIHGPNAMTLEALETTLARAEAAERDFIQVHKNCIEARARAEKAEQALSARRLTEGEQALQRAASQEPTLLSTFGHPARGEPVAWRYTNKRTGDETFSNQPPDRVSDLAVYDYVPLYVNSSVK